MRKIAKQSVLVLILSTLIWLTACERSLSGDDKAAVLAFSEAITDNMFAGLATNDYAAFSRDFDSDMYERPPAAEFSAWKEGLEEVIGAYLSRNVDKVTRSDEFYVVTYQAEFEKEEQVTVTVAFHASDHSIAFLAFESEKYSWSAWE